MSAAKGPHVVAVVNGELISGAEDRIRDLLVGADRVIAVDGGLRHCTELGVVPDDLVGDLDSAPATLIDQARAGKVGVHEHPADKDETDLELALGLACSQGAECISVVAAFGGRLDHELATISLLASDRWRDVSIEATDGQRHLWVVHDQVALRLAVGATASLLPWHGDVGGVTTRGLKWPLSDARLQAGSTRGVSNIATAPEQYVAIATGVLVVVADPE